MVVMPVDVDVVEATVDVAMLVVMIVDGSEETSMLMLLVLESIQPEARMVHTAAMVFRHDFIVGLGMMVVGLLVVVMMREEAESSSMCTVRNPVIMMVS